MALPATHMRFAATLAEQLAVADTAAYYSGTLYPDSRWVTGIDRMLTHAPRCLDPEFPHDDFTAGWHVHCQCDRIQGDIHIGLIEDLDEMTADDRWIRLAAAKVVQDSNDAAQGNIGDRLGMLTEARTPNGESAERVAAYFGAVRRAYGRQNTPDWPDYVGLWAAVGLDRHRILQIEQQVQRITADDLLTHRLHETFEQMVGRWAYRFSDRPDQTSRP